MPAKKLNPPKKKSKPKTREVKNPDGGILDSISPVSLSNDQLSNALIYGSSGDGKTTTFACTWPKPILLISAAIEEGTDSVADVEGILSPRPVKSVDEYLELLNFAKESGNFKTVATDTVGRLQDIVFQDIVGRPAPRQMSWGEVSQETWGEIARAMKHILSQSIELSIGSEMNSVLIAQQKEFNVKSDGSVGELKPKISAEVIPSVSKWLEESVNAIIRCCIRLPEIEVDNLDDLEKIPDEVYQYSVQLVPDGIHKAKLRKPKSIKLPNYLEDPSYDKITDLIRG